MGDMQQHDDYLVESGMLESWAQCQVRSEVLAWGCTPWSKL
jgi:hypothetical protein